MLLGGNISNSFAQGVDNPRFFEYRSNSLLGQIFDVSFGWWKTLNPEQKKAFYGTIAIALDEAQPGQFVRWHEDDASGVVRVKWQLPRDQQICKRLDISVIAYNSEKVYSKTACYDESYKSWRWTTE